MDHLQDKDYELTIVKASNGYICKFWDDIVADQPTIRLDYTIFEDNNCAGKTKLQNLKELLYFVASYFGQYEIDIDVTERE